MGLFDKQIRRRLQNDQNVLEDSLFQLASVVMDKWTEAKFGDQLVFAKGAIDDILHYYHEKPVEIPENITGIVEQMEYAFRPAGLMMRDVELKEGWYKDAYGPMLGYLKDSGTLVALIPNAFKGYSYKDPGSGNKVKINRKTAKLLSSEAMCFYKSLPMKALGIKDLLLYTKDCFSYGDVIMAIIATLGVTVVGMIEPKIYGLVTGPVLRIRQLSLLIGVMSFLIASAFASQMINMVKQLLVSRISTKTDNSVEAAVMIRVLSLPVSFFREYSAGELAKRVQSVSTLVNLIITNLFSVGLTSIMSLLYVGQIFKYAPGLVWPSLIITFLSLTITVVASLMQMKVTKRQMEIDAKASGISFSALEGIQKIKLCGAEKRVFSRWGKLYAQVAQLSYNPPLFLKVNAVIQTAVTMIGTIVIYYIAVKTEVGFNQYYAFQAAYGRLSAGFTALAGIVTSLASIKPILEMAEPILKAEPEVASDKKNVVKLSGKIEMSHVSFRYDETTPYILKDLSLKIKAGEYVAIVGRTGCGKSTLVRNLLGFDKPENGSIFFDQYDLNTVDIRSLRRKIGVVMQDGQLFQGDIFSNITISAPQLTLDEAWEAAEIAGIADDIREMPMGMNTIISEGQGGVSGGQKQRLLIARAVAPKPKILILDEATSALDNKTQKQVSDALDNLKCTRIVIAHRLSTIKHADRILVLSNGEIIEEGTYDELIALGGEFKTLVERQRLDN